MAWLPDGEKDLFALFWHNPRTWQKDGQTDRHRTTAKAARQKCVQKQSKRREKVPNKFIGVTGKPPPPAYISRRGWSFHGGLLWGGVRGFLYVAMRRFCRCPKMSSLKSPCKTSYWCAFRRRGDLTNCFNYFTYFRILVVWLWPLVNVIRVNHLL